jgi:DNA (cytosine-5)-methyltransferase 1
VGENVYGLVNWNGGLVFDTVCADLENEGFQVIPIILPAASVNAPHKRDRIFFVAYSGACEHRGKPTEIHGTAEEKYGSGNEQSPSPWKQIQLPFEPGSIFWDVTDTKGEGSWEFSSENSGRSGGRLDYYGQNEHAADSNGSRFKTFNNKNAKLGEQSRTKAFSGDLAESIHTRGRWDSFPTQSPICGRDDGIPSQLDGISFSKWRNESIKGYGNAVVPQVVHQIFKAIAIFESQSHTHGSAGT